MGRSENVNPAQSEHGKPQPQTYAIQCDQHQFLLREQRVAIALHSEDLPVGSQASEEH